MIDVGSGLSFVDLAIGKKAFLFSCFALRGRKLTGIGRFEVDEKNVLPSIFGKYVLTLSSTRNRS